jgi:hypothetical protein
MDPQAQDVLQQILLKLGGLERSVARQDETLKAVQGDVKAVSERVETMQVTSRRDVEPKLWVVHKQIKINDMKLHVDEDIVTAPSSLNSGLSVEGFYSNLTSCNAACRAAFFAYMKDKFAWNEQEVLDNINETLDGPEMQRRDGSVLYYWEGPVVWKHWIKEKEVETEAYAVISFSPYVVKISD